MTPKSQTKRIYIGGRFTLRENLKPIREKIQEKGYLCKSFWLDQPSDLVHDHDIPRSTHRDTAIRDLDDLHASDMIVFDVRGANGKGMFFEMGYALAINKYVVIVGETEPQTIFTSLATQHFSNWEQFLETL